MRILIASVFAAIAAVSAAPARADEPQPAAASTDACEADGDAPACPHPRVEIGVRAGGSLPLGSLQKDAKLGDLADGQVPLWVDVGLRLDRHWYVGAYGAVGYVLPASGGCPPGASCSGTDVRVGLQAQYRFLPEHRLSPWVGVGAGYEWLHASASWGDASAAVTLHGFELVNLQAGADYRVCDGLSVGPFAALSFGEFASASASVTSRERTQERAGSIDETAVHEWVTLGLRGHFGL